MGFETVKVMKHGHVEKCEYTIGVGIVYLLYRLGLIVGLGNLYALQRYWGHELSVVGLYGDARTDEITVFKWY